MSAMNSQPHRRGGRLPGAMALLALILLLLAALLMVGAGPAYRLEWLTLGSAFDMLRYGGYAALGAAGLGLITLIVAAVCRRMRPALIGVLVVAASLAMMAVPWAHWQRAQEVPPIHDITTDTEDPPTFEALAPAREAAPNAVDYPGETFARQQRDAYPDIEPLLVDASMPEVLSAAETEVLEHGWELAEITEDKIEATATTTWFGFHDDVVIRLAETDDGVRVDVRSASRLGRGDAGTNAARIRSFMQALEERL